MKNSFYRDTFKTLILIVLILGLCKVTMGGAAVLVALMGAVFAIQKKGGYLAVCYALFPLFTVFNRVVTGISPVFLMTARMGNLFMIAAMMLTGAGFSGRMRERLPIGWMFAYMFVACLSSIDGWMPLISYLKIVQLALFIIGLYFVTRVLQQDEKGVYQIRCVFMAFSILMLPGSLMARFVPSIGYSMMESRFVAYNLGLTAEQQLEAGNQILFNGLACHSQMLPPMVAMLGAWVLCDMLLVEKRICKLHVAILSCAPVLLYLSRSRGGLIELVAVMMTAFFVCVPRAKLKAAVKSKLTMALFGMIALLTIVAIVAQVRNQTISKWLRKTDDIGGDTRSLSEAFTGSRQALLEYNLSDFKRNPLLGMGFQVVQGMEQAYRAKLITWYSASIEKGVTPYVILGETGLIGAGVFVIFLISFYVTCLKRRYLSLLTSFTCVLVCNLADSTLFSPGGIGGFLWICSCVGAFSTDLLVKRLDAQRSLPPPGWDPAAAPSLPPPGWDPPAAPSLPPPGPSLA